MIDSLIDKQDNFELVGLKIVDILKTEIENQKALALASGKDAALWDLRVFYERSNAWEQYLNDTTIDTPIVNVWLDNTSFDPSKSNEIEYQMAESTFNVDVYAYGKAAADGTGGQIAGDLLASTNLFRAIKLVRNILMSAFYTYLDMRGLVSRRWPSSISIFQPQLDNLNMQQVIGSRLALSVQYLEFSPQFQPVPLESVFSTIVDEDTSEVLLQAEFDYT